MFFVDYIRQLLPLATHSMRNRVQHETNRDCLLGASHPLRDGLALAIQLKNTMFWTDYPPTV